MHPFKYTQGLVKAALEMGAKLYTDTKVEKLEKQADGSYLVFTNNGVIHTEKVIITTNGYTQAILPELNAIQPWISHILNYKHTLNQMKGMTFTARQGDIYFNFPKQEWYVDADGFMRGTLHQGGGRDTPIDPKLISQFPFDQFSFEIIHNEANEVTPDTRGRPPERAWSGIMGFTPDRLPVISFRYTYEKVNGKRQIVEDKNLIIVSADSGYGGSKLNLAARIGAQMAITGEIPRDIIPDDMFSNLRFMKPGLTRIFHQVS